VSINTYGDSLATGREQKIVEKISY
jgi:hypothetical protein